MSNTESAKAALWVIAALTSTAALVMFLIAFITH